MYEKGVKFWSIILQKSLLLINVKVWMCVFNENQIIGGGYINMYQKGLTENR